MIITVEQQTTEIDESMKVKAKLEDDVQRLEISQRDSQQKISELSQEIENLKKDVNLKDQTIHLKVEENKVLEVKLASIEREKDHASISSDGNAHGKKIYIDL